VLGREDYTKQSGLERHYRVKELAAMWKLSPAAIARIFDAEPDVLCLDNEGSGKRMYRTRSIPESVAVRVHEQRSRPRRIIRLRDIFPKRPREIVKLGLAKTKIRR
jgi:hypothetical protein